MSRTFRTLLVAGAALAIPAVPALAQDEASSDPRVTVLQQQLRDVRSELDDLKLNRTVESKAPAQPRVGLEDGRLTITSADGAFSVSLRGLMQYDMGYFAQGKNGGVADLSSGTNFRRAQIAVVGTAWHDWAYNFTLDFAGNGVEKSGYIYNAYVEYDGLKPFAVRIGAYTPPGGLEDQTSASDLLFMEYASPVEAARNTAGAPSRSAVSLILRQGSLFGALSYTGDKVGDSGSFDEQQALVGRAAFLAVNTPEMKWLLDTDFTQVLKPADKVPGSPPLTTLLHSVSFSSGPELGVDNNAPKTVTTGTMDADSATIFGVESAAEYQALYLQGGYFHYGVSRRDPALPDPGFHGWYALATFSLTGETHGFDASSASFRSLRPLHGLGRGGIGAWEVKARYSSMDFNFDPLAAASAGGVAGGIQNVWTVGLNWYPTNGIRFELEYSNLHVSHINAPAAELSADEFGLRTQLAL